MCPMPKSSSIVAFDGRNKVDGLIPPAIQNTDWSNPKLATAVSDVAGMGQTAPRFCGLLTLATTTGGLSMPTWRAVWQNVTSTAPVLSRTTTGVFTVTLPSVVSDEYDGSLGITNNIAVSLFACSSSLTGTSAGLVNASASGSVITIHTFNTSGSANDLSGNQVLLVAFSAN